MVEFDINIVIVNYKTKDDVDLCLSSVFREINNSQLRVVVHLMDNSDNIDGVRELIEGKYPKVKYINSGGNIGFGAAQNIGLKKERAEYYLVLNPDVEFIEGEKTLEKMFQFMEENENIGIVGPKTLNIDGSVQLSCSRNFGVFDQIARRLNLDKRSEYFKSKVDKYLMRDFDHNKTIKVDWLIGSFLFIRKELFEKNGYFDDRFFMYFEDCDICRRSWEAGYEVVYNHKIRINHKHKRDSAVESPFISVFVNRVTRIHLKSWLKYLWKWGVKKKHFGK